MKNITSIYQKRICCALNQGDIGTEVFHPVQAIGIHPMRPGGVTKIFQDCLRALAEKVCACGNQWHCRIIENLPANHLPLAVPMHLGELVVSFRRIPSFGVDLTKI